MVRYIRKYPIRFIIKTVLNVVYGICIFGISILVFTEFEIVKGFVPPNVFKYMSALFVIFQTVKTALENVKSKPNDKDRKKKQDGSSTIRI